LIKSTKKELLLQGDQKNVLRKSKTNEGEKKEMGFSPKLHTNPSIDVDE
jgi:hypothetical protein